MKFLERLYYDPSEATGYAGASRLTRAVRSKKTSGARVLDWLAGQNAYTLHKSVRRKFPRARYSVQNIDDLWEADLVDLRSIKAYNDGYAYLLVVIDVLSKFAWVEPIPDKTAVAVAGAFERVLASSERCPIYLQTDKGKEFLGVPFQKLLAGKNVRYRTTRNPDIKAAVVERFNRTLKERMWRYFTHKNTHRYVDILPQLVRAYNDASHSTIKMAPSRVTLENAAVARSNMENARGGARGETKQRFRAGELVRISKAKGAFRKGYEANWTEEVFRIRRVLTRAPVVYELEDLRGEEIDGLFYDAELQRVIKGNDVSTIDKIIRTRGKGRSKKLFVSWRGYPEKFNSWIAASSLPRST
jgi:hypothetical protein